MISGDSFASEEPRLPVSDSECGSGLCCPCIGKLSCSTISLECVYAPGEKQHGDCIHIHNVWLLMYGGHGSMWSTPRDPGTWEVTLGSREVPSKTLGGPAKVIEEMAR